MGGYGCAVCGCRFVCECMFIYMCVCGCVSSVCCVLGVGGRSVMLFIKQTDLAGYLHPCNSLYLPEGGRLQRLQAFKALSSPDTEY